MMKRIFALMILLAMAVSLGGCQEKIKETVEQGEAPDFLTIDFSSTLICTVKDVVQDKCIAEVTEGNGTYDPETMVVISFAAVSDEAELTEGEVITFIYDYAVDVSAYSKYEGTSDTYHNIPHIRVEEITVIPDYIPPETEPETTAE